MADQKAETVAWILVECVFTRHGISELLLSDRGSNFLSSVVEEVCKLVEINMLSKSVGSMREIGTGTYLASLLHIEWPYMTLDKCRRFTCCTGKNHRFQLRWR